MFPLTATMVDSWNILGGTSRQGMLADLIVGLLLLLTVGLIIDLHRRRNRQTKNLIDELASQRQQSAEALRKAEQGVHEKTALLRSILESPQSVVIFALDPSYCYLQFTSAHKETIQHIWGADIQVGMNMLDVISAADQRESAKRNFDCALRGEWLLLIEEYGDAQHRTFYENRYSPIMDADGKVTGLTVFVLDISDRKHADEQLRRSLRQAEALTIQVKDASRAKSEFLSVMSHELLTPLNGVLGIAGILGTTPLDENQKDLVQTIHESGERLLDMVNNILDFSSFDKNGIRLNVGQIVLCDLMETCCGTIREATLKKGLGFRSELAPGVPEHFVGDEPRIRQILSHLLQNAVKFTARGAVFIRVSPIDEGTRKLLEFTVHDSGPGIAPEALGRLFQPFGQADSSSQRPFEGPGLGLAISRRLAEAMQGTLTVDSTPGLGSTFILRLPLN